MSNRGLSCWVFPLRRSGDTVANMTSPEADILRLWVNAG